MNDEGKLEVVQVSAHNSSDFDTMRLRPMGRSESKNKKVGGRVQMIYLSVGRRGGPNRDLLPNTSVPFS